MTDETEESEIGLLLRAARGDTDAAIALSYHCAAIADNGVGDKVVATIEGMLFARMAAVTGSIVGIGQVISYCGRMIDICEEAGRPELVSHYRGEAFALSDFAADMVPSDESDVITTGMASCAADADPATMQCAHHLRSLWAEALSNPIEER